MATNVKIPTISKYLMTTVLHSHSTAFTDLKLNIQSTDMLNTLMFKLLHRLDSDLKTRHSNVTYEDVVNNVVHILGVWDNDLPSDTFEALEFQRYVTNGLQYLNSHIDDNCANEDTIQYIDMLAKILNCVMIKLLEMCGIEVMTRKRITIDVIDVLSSITHDCDFMKTFNQLISFEHFVVWYAKLPIMKSKRVLAHHIRFVTLERFLQAWFQLRVIDIPDYESFLRTNSPSDMISTLHACADMFSNV